MDRCIKVKGAELYDNYYDGLVGFDTTLIVNDTLDYELCVYEDMDGDVYLLVRGAMLVIDIETLDAVWRDQYIGYEYVLIPNYGGYGSDVEDRMKDGSVLLVSEETVDAMRDTVGMIEVRELIPLNGQPGNDLIQYFL